MEIPSQAWRELPLDCFGRDRQHIASFKRDSRAVNFGIGSLRGRVVVTSDLGLWSG